MHRALALTMVLACSGPATSSPPVVVPAAPVVDAPPPDAPVDAPPVADPEPAVGAPPAHRLREADLEPGPKAARAAKFESQAAIAARVNREGRRAALDGKYDVASSRFREAVARVPEPGYFFNLCTSLYLEGKFTEALTACNAVEHVSPTAALATKTKTLTERILDEAHRQQLDVR